MNLFQTEFNSFQGLNIARKSSILCVGGVPQTTSAMVFPKKKLFIRVKLKCKMFKKPYYSRSRSTTPANSKDVVICNNSLRFKAVYYRIVTMSSILNVGRGHRGFI